MCRQETLKNSQALSWESQGCGFSCPDKPEILESGSEILGASEGMEKIGQAPCRPAVPQVCALSPWLLEEARRGS